MRCWIVATRDWASGVVQLVLRVSLGLDIVKQLIHVLKINKDLASHSNSTQERKKNQELNSFPQGIR